MPPDMDAIARVVASVAKAAQAPLIAEIATLKADIAALKARQPEKGDAGQPGADGKCGINGIDGKNGRDGIDGKDADLDVVKSLIWETVDKAVSALPAAKDGRDGVDGKDGRDGLSGQPGRDGEKGADGLNGKDGADGLGFDDLTVEYDGQRTFTFKWQRGDVVKEFPFDVPMLIDRGVYREGETYQRGDVVTWGGSMWIAQIDDTRIKPGENSKAWRLSVKRGSDGKQGPEGKGGPQGPQGPMGPQGTPRY